MIVHPQSKSVILNAPDPFLIRDMIPLSQSIRHKDFNVAVKHTTTTTRVLRELGFDVPAPILSQYRWPGKYKPFDHQLVMAEFLTMHKKAFNLSEMGVGKSAASLWAADWLMTEGLIKKALILAPLSTLERVWANDIFDVLMHRTCSIVHGTLDRRMAALETDVDFYILNHDGVNISEVNEAIRRNPDIGLVILDEASMFRNSQTNKYKSLKKMVRDDMRLWLLTGTPCPNDPTDAWALARLISPERVPRFFGAFKRLTMMQLSQFRWEPRPDAYKTAYEAMQPATRFKKVDCLTLPPVTEQDRQAELSAEQTREFKAMQKIMKAEAKASTITAVNAADKINKLRQILCGAIKDPETGDYLTLDHKKRAQTLLDAIGEADAKVLVVVPFKGIINELEKTVKKHHSVAVLNGDVSPKRRDKIILDFKTTPDPHVLLCHPKVMAHGLNLTEADTLIFYAPIYSNDEFQQVVERFNRTGQTRKMTIIRMGAHPLEWRIYSMVDKRRDTQDNILALYKSVTT